MSELRTSSGTGSSGPRATACVYVGLHETTVAKCVCEQEAVDMVLDKLSIVEREDPFWRGSKKRG